MDCLKGRGVYTLSEFRVWGSAARKVSASESKRFTADVAGSAYEMPESQKGPKTNIVPLSRYLRPESIPGGSIVLHPTYKTTNKGTTVEPTGILYHY